MYTMSEIQPSSKETNKILKNVQNGNTNYIEDFFRKYSNLHWSALYYDKTGDTILHISARLGHVNLVHFILNTFKSDAVDCKNKDDKTALHEAAQFGQLEACRILLSYGANVNAIKRADWTPLMLSCTKINGNDNYKIVELFVQHGACVNFKNKDGWTALHLICREGDGNILKLLVTFGLDLEGKTKNGRTALHIATLHGHLNIVDILLTFGLTINERDNCGNTPLHEAVLSGNIDICKFVINNGANIDLRNKSDYTLLHLASAQGHINVIKYLLDELKFNINEQNINGLTALHCAAKKNETVYKVLLEMGADENILDNFSRKPNDYLHHS